MDFVTKIFNGFGSFRACQLATFEIFQLFQLKRLKKWKYLKSDNFTKLSIFKKKSDHRIVEICKRKKKKNEIEKKLLFIRDSFAKKGRIYGRMSIAVLNIKVALQFPY